MERGRSPVIQPVKGPQGESYPKEKDDLLLRNSVLCSRAVEGGQMPSLGQLDERAGRLTSHMPFSPIGGNMYRVCRY